MKRISHTLQNRILLLVFGTAVVWSFVICYAIQRALFAQYQRLASSSLADRNGNTIKIYPNQNGYYARFDNANISPRIQTLLLRKEDQWFYVHPGLNPISIVRDVIRMLTFRKPIGSSTITQQLAKILLGNETRRYSQNKLTELYAAIALELWTSKKTILAMYLDTAYFGNHAQGINEASHYYFNKTPDALRDDEIMQLLAALNNPTYRYPGTRQNIAAVKALTSQWNIQIDAQDLKTADHDRSRSAPPAFETAAFQSCVAPCRLTIDRDLTEKLRATLFATLALPAYTSAQHGAIVVVKLPENELLAIVGSPNPLSRDPGDQINMAVEPRPIGSTIKPFIYLKAFEKKARPYTLVDDREYRYKIGTGFEFYPKNFDGQYRGLVTLHDALAGSMNVPTVRILEFVGIKPFASFLENDLGFIPLRPTEEYSIGIALGGLEMDLLTLATLFTIFPNEGVLKPLIVGYGDQTALHHTPPMMHPLYQKKRVADRRLVALINKILFDRMTGVEQFGIRSSLNLSQGEYALKTGTSRDFHDSWTIGYTPDFLVGVWIGNSNNTPMHQLSGQNGAGRIWHHAMDILLNSVYNHNRKFSFDGIANYTRQETTEYGLLDDDYDQMRSVLARSNPLILSPHDGDVFLFEPTTTIPLIARESVRWSVNNRFLHQGEEFSWKPSSAGVYAITATTETRTAETHTITVQKEETRFEQKN